MANDRIKVPGYASKTTYLGDSVEYRNFSPDLVGLQLTDNGGTSLFTLGNFAITTNLDPTTSRNFGGNTTFSNFVSLTDLDLTLSEAYLLLRNNAGVILNLDKKKLTNYSLFSSFREYTRVALENIIINWPAGLYISPIYSAPPNYITLSGLTYESNSYNQYLDESSFSLNVNVISNQYQINFLKNGNLGGTFNEKNELRDLTKNYSSYSILINNEEYDVIGFTGSTFTFNDYIFFKVKGNPFSGNSNGYTSYYVKPNKKEENLFFNSLPDFEYYLLNRSVIPKYTSTFDFTVRTDGGAIVHTQSSLTWPVTDGYNIDFDTDSYVDYATQLLDICDKFDLSTSNLMIRFLVTESITDFDTTAVHLDPLDVDDTGQKVNKTLVIYGREYDDINQYITGIKLANTVTYDKQDNTPDIYLKNIAKVMGWELISSVLEQNLLKSYVIPNTSTYQGQSVGLTPIEADIELWRRIILNTPWIWKSKGTRKSIEFLFKFIGTPLGLIQFNEYVYVAEKNIDFADFETQLIQNKLPVTNIFTTYPIDFDGYPNPLPNTSDLYYQGLGLWYRETGGNDASTYINSGNNPHSGPYDKGYKYIKQFSQLIPNYSAVTISSETVTTNTTNIFYNYNYGTITQYTGNTFVDLTATDGSSFSDCYVVDTRIILDPKKRQDKTNCGCDIPENLKSLSVCVNRKEPIKYDCNKDIASYQLTTNGNLYYVYNYYQYNTNGSIYTVNNSPVYNQSIFVNPQCCNVKNSESIFYNETDSNNTVINTGYICCTKSGATQTQGDCGCFVTCKWKIDSVIRKVEQPFNSGIYYLVFIDELGNRRTTSYNGCNCIKGYTVPVSVTDPYTNQTGIACQLTSIGIYDINQYNSIIVKTYIDRANGTIGCNQIAQQTTSQPPSTQPASKIYAVILNNTSQIGKKVQDLRFEQLVQPAGGNFSNFNTPLTANTNGIGYFYGYTPQNMVYGSNVEMQINTGTTILGLPPVDLAFNPNIGHKMYFLQTTTEYNLNTFNSQLSNLRRLTVSSRVPQNTPPEYYATYQYNYLATPMYTYMVWDFRGEAPPQTQNNTVCYTFTNTSISAQTYNWTDVNGVRQSGQLAAGTSIGKCAIRGTQSGTNIQISGGNTPCTNDNECSVVQTGRLFTVVNNTDNTVIDVMTNGIRLPYASFNGYPLNYGTVSGLRSGSFNTAIVVKLNLIQTADIVLNINTYVVQTLRVNVPAGGSIPNYSTTLNLFSISSTDVITITITPV